MRNLFAVLILAFLLFKTSPAFCDVVQGGVEKQTIIGRNKVIDSATNAPISNARVTLPQEQYSTYTDSNGNFALDVNITGPTVLSVEKAGYKPFSITVNQNTASRSLVMGIEKSTPHDITIDTSMVHLGDNSYSELSANANQFRVESVGPFYSKRIKIPTLASGTRVTLVLGSIIGVDTLIAKEMGQNKINNAYASAPEVFFNGNKIAEIQINGDRQKIKVPYKLVRQNQLNEVTIKTGRNLMQTAYVDYDDIEIMNLSIETK